MLKKINRITADENQRRLLKQYIEKDNKRDFLTLINEIEKINQTKERQL